MFHIQDGALGRLAYETFCQMMNGYRMPAWDELDALQRAMWDMRASHALQRLHESKHAAMGFEVFSPMTGMDVPSTPPVERAPGRIRFEYRVVAGLWEVRDPILKLDEYGADGWELVTVNDDGRHVFKRVRHLLEPKRWEYMVTLNMWGDMHLDNAFNGWGNGGWELVACNMAGTAIFKRPKTAQVA